MDKDLKDFLTDNDITDLQKLRDFMRFNLDASIVNHNVAPDFSDVKMAKIESYFDKIFDSMLAKERDNYQMYQSEQMANWLSKVTANNLAESKALDD